ncbi:purine-nucleoside phosphorylase [Mycoplasma tauri]|uniref:Uridine phosphorylase n=1 Tax=Mycoplasma tauri TaxID=547987 RepID=A0A953T531_9MOLU|nr:purine-nucleoside phosphorylase [Mycoplasma tauri]MBZ4195615.1 purine-nucleoside phosphorylase [Mycoplasma tauri]MBZ4203469.1 purine-nucleoside phosphorylase [Mycoplasma tauri]MBZ4204538.1 purine-nucleoside phosphorylase [Mycoplasma tauri]MBZ4212959.1 purine-nucleoside phosphorylase [Mycoplasma tauri]MBZ4218383.1 purine-nucleoside phosphorylase [Mycoplasma tauri]
MTPHINAKAGQIAKVVLMPGDPLRAKYIADTFLDEGYEIVNTVRNMLMFTGTYKGRKITIAASGMGCPSIGIYSYELFNFYGVEKIVRIGSAGSYKADLKLYDTVLVDSCYSDSNAFRRLVVNDHSSVAYPSVELNEELEKHARELNIPLTKVRAHSSDVFYSSVPLEERIKETQADCVEMESYALFTNAERLGKKAACLLTISDNLITHEETTPEERQSAFTNMMKIALELAQ